MIAPKAIGQGGMGTIYLANDKKAGRQYAVKKLMLSKTTDLPALQARARCLNFYCSLTVLISERDRYDAHVCPSKCGRIHGKFHVRPLSLGCHGVHGLWLPHQSAPGMIHDITFTCSISDDTCIGQAFSHSKVQLSESEIAALLMGR